MTKLTQQQNEKFTSALNDVKQNFLKAAEKIKELQRQGFLILDVTTSSAKLKQSFCKQNNYQSLQIFNVNDIYYLLGKSKENNPIELQLTIFTHDFEDLQKALNHLNLKFEMVESVNTANYKTLKIFSLNPHDIYQLGRFFYAFQNQSAK